jgi:CubicO group peptidase (beta-lactamase class C family)
MKWVNDCREITIRDCLTHSSGLGSGEVGNYQFLRNGEPKNLKENVLAWNGALLDFASGTKQGYSAVVAFELLAYIVEIVSGSPFDVFLKQEIFDPLGMKDTGYRLSEKDKGRLVEMTKTSDTGGLENIDFGLRGFDAFAEGYTGGSAGLFSTLEDYSKFVRMLANKGTYNGRQILAPKSVAKMGTPQLSSDIEGISKYFNWGLGVRVCEKQGEWQVLPDGSFGWSGAYGTHFWVEPNTGRAAVLMLNKADVGGSASPYSYEFEKLVTGAVC